MTQLNLKPTHKIVKTYYRELQRLANQPAGNPQKEGAVAPLFSPLLRYCANQCDRVLIEQYTLDKGHKNLFLDGAIVDSFNLIYGVWEAKDTDDKLEHEVRQKFRDGYPKDNILFQAPQRAILYQNGQQVADADLTRPENLVSVLHLFFAWEPPQFEEWRRAVNEFSGKVKDIGVGLLNLIEKERQSNNTRFITAFDNFVTICRDNINPNISIQAVKEMLIQHLLTERLFRKVFDRADFANLNVIAREIEKVVLALVTPHGGRNRFFQPLDRFYYAIESTAAVIRDFSEKQAFLNTVYEKFFQGFSVNVADKYGIVYTPQPVVDFMVNSVEDILQTEFGRSLSDKNVHILDPFVGTGNFLIRVMRKIQLTALRRKYEEELHCNEVMLLPYYIASMNIEQEYYTLAGEYRPFAGICFVDTFQLAEDRQLPLFAEENTQRVKRQQETPIFVILGNPPYNVGQINENDNNKNRRYEVIDKKVRQTYAQDSAATNKNALADVYVKAVRWASDRILKEGEGVVAFITNNGFVDGFAFDGMRKHLAQDFNRLYILDLQGNVRKDSMREGFPIGEAHTVFGLAAMVGISISFLVKNKQYDDYKIYYSTVDWRASRKEKFALLEQAGTIRGIDWQEIRPDARHTWLTEGMSQDFESFIPMGTKAAKRAKTAEVEVIFKNYGRGVGTSRDAWAYNFDKKVVAEKMKTTIEFYNEQVGKWTSWLKSEENSKFYQLKVTEQKQIIDEFVTYDDTKLNWTRDLKKHFRSQTPAEFSESKIRSSLYRPFTRTYLFFDHIMNNEGFTFFSIFPTPAAESDNRVICLTAVGNKKPFHCLMTNMLPDLHLTGDSQCFPFYTYDEDPSSGSGQVYSRRENITDWALAQFQQQYDDHSITKWNLFYYIYALLHHPQYRERCAANLKRGLPRIPFVPVTQSGVEGRLSSEVEGRLSSEVEISGVEGFWAFTEAGKRLADLHVHYEQQPEYPLDLVEHVPPEASVSLRELYRVEKMRLSKDQTQIVYNDYLTLAGIPPEAFEYRLGTRSALHWVLDQYRVKTDKRSGIVNDPNRDDDPDYIIRLIKQVLTVSLDTVNILQGLPELEIIA